MGYFCAPLRSLLDRDMAQRLYDQGRTDEQIATICCVVVETVKRWRLGMGLPPNGKHNHEDYLADIKQCEKCIYWRGENSYSTGIFCCHHLLETGKRRVQENGVCLSQMKRRAYG